MRPRRALVSAVILALALALGACGLDVQEPDLFLLTRTGQGPRLTLLVNSGGTIRCNGGRARTISDARLIQARDLSDNLGNDASAHLRLPTVAGSVAYYTIRMEQGTIRFPDIAARTRRPLAQAELFATETAQQVCGLAG